MMNLWMDTAQTRWTARHKQHIGQEACFFAGGSVGRAFSVCAPCLPHREADIHKKVYRCGIAAVRSPVYNKCRAHSCVSPPDYRTIQIKEHPYVNQQPVHSRLRPFFPQRRGTSHSRHGADADGSSLGDPPARAGLADVCRTASLPHLRIHGGGRIFSHPQLLEIRPATCAVCHALRSTVRPDVRRNLVLSGAPERDLDAAARSSGHSSDGNRAQKTKKHGCTCSPPCLLC